MKTGESKRGGRQEEITGEDGGRQKGGDRGLETWGDSQMVKRVETEGKTIETEVKGHDK